MSDAPHPSAPVSKAEARATAERYARLVIDATGGPVTPQGPSSSDSPCPEDGTAGPARYSILHMYNVEVPFEQQNAALTRARDTLATAGFAIEAFTLSTVAESPGGRLVARMPADRFLVRVLSTSPPREITIWVGTPCLRDTAPTGAPGASHAPASGLDAIRTVLG